MVELKKNHFYLHLKTKPNFIPLSLSWSLFFFFSQTHTLSLDLRSQRNKHVQEAPPEEGREAERYRSGSVELFSFFFGDAGSGKI